MDSVWFDYIATPPVSNATFLESVLKGITSGSDVIVESRGRHSIYNFDLDASDFLLMFRSKLEM